MDTREKLVVIGDRIRNARKRAKLSQTELGRLVGYSINGIGKIERGESDPKFSVLANIAEALGMPTQALVTDAKSLYTFPPGSMDLIGPIFGRAMREAEEQLDEEQREQLAREAKTFSRGIGEALDQSDRLKAADEAEQ